MRSQKNYSEKKAKNPWYTVFYAIIKGWIWITPMIIGVTGPRVLTPQQQHQASQDLKALTTTATALHAGDALGLDALARAIATSSSVPLHEHNTQGRRPWQLQQRSKRLVEALAAAGGTLHAWPNKPCPAGLTPSSWKGSGTWGTVRYAVALGVPVELHPLAEFVRPEWLAQKQLALF